MCLSFEHFVLDFNFLASESAGFNLRFLQSKFQKVKYLNYDSVGLKECLDLLYSAHSAAYSHELV